MSGTRIDFSVCHACDSALTFLNEVAILEALAALDISDYGTDPNEIVVTAILPEKQGPPEEEKSCDAGWNQFGERLADTGEFLENAGLAGAGIGALTGVGAAGGLFVAAIGDVIQLGGHGIRFLAGNKEALGDAAVSPIPGPKAVVPKSLRNDIGDVASEVAYGEVEDMARPGKTGC